MQCCSAILSLSISDSIQVLSLLVLAGLLIIITVHVISIILTLLLQVPFWDPYFVIPSQHSIHSNDSRCLFYAGSEAATSFYSLVII